MTSNAHRNPSTRSCGRCEGSVDDRGPTIVRAATWFYAAAVAIACIYAAVFGHFDRLLGESAPPARSLFNGLVLGLLIVGVSHLAFAMFSGARRATTMMARMLGPITVGQAIWLAVLSGFAEELLFRGALWPHLGLVGGAVLFGIVHTVPVRALAFYPVFAFLAGLVLGLLRENSGSLWPPVLCHFIINALNLAWIGRLERRRLASITAPSAFPTATTPPPETEMLPLDQEVGDAFPRTVWRYHMHVELSGTDRQSLPDCLEAEELVLFQIDPREEVYERLREGNYTFAATLAEPFTAFPDDVAAISVYLFQIVIGIEVAERFVDETTTDDVRAWKVAALRGEWVKVPLLVEETEPGRFDVDTDREDVEVLAARWHEYPRWFQDGMRYKYPRLRDLE